MKNQELSNANYLYNKSNYETDNETIKRRLAAQEVKDNKLLDDDYAARGLFGSGLFSKADTDLGTSYSDQYTDLATSLNRNLQQLLTDLTSQQNLDQDTLRQAQLDAITRRAQEFGFMGGPSNETGEEEGGGGGGGRNNGGKGRKNNGGRGNKGGRNNNGGGRNNNQNNGGGRGGKNNNEDKGGKGKKGGKR